MNTLTEMNGCDMKYQVFVNNLFMSGHLTEAGARNRAKGFTEGRVEIRTVLLKGDK